MEEMMLKLSEFHHNHHPSGVKMLAKFIRRGIRVDLILKYTDNIHIRENNCEYNGLKWILKSGTKQKVSQIVEILKVI